MTSSTPPPYCTLTTTKPYQNHHSHHLQNHLQNRNSHHQHWASQKVSLHNNNPSHTRNAAPKPPSGLGPTADPGSPFPSLFSADFSGHAFWPPQVNSLPPTHICCGVQQALFCGGDHNYIDDILLSFEPKLRGSDD
ncbi:Hypothetical predicted protein [Olea europaea subsp. europaea]|uniref:Uncharacterized protein n=1 Tax=Olea europaea subsp. europaea TaxID=158383 RepID=A0A8S0QCE8_OLEEU|nr:Hypothetical predicted protein [Olea europaea subsp. europaea]